MHIFNMCICAFEGKSMNRIGKKIAWMSLSGMMIFSLSACGKKDNAADETLIDPDYIVQEYETTTTDEGYTTTDEVPPDKKHLVAYFLYMGYTE